MTGRPAEPEAAVDDRSPEELDRPASGPPELGPGDLELLRLLGDGLSVDQIARRAGSSERTVRRRCRTICDRLGVQAPIQAVVWAARRGLL